MMRGRLAAGLLCLAAVGGCGLAQPNTSTPLAPTVRPTPSSASPAPLPTTVSAPFPDSMFPLSFPITDSLLDGSAAEIVAELHRVAGGLPVLKVDITAQQATLTALLGDNRVASYAWRDGEIRRVDSDFQYLQQATFDPADFPISSLRRIFDVAGMNGVRGTELVLQIGQYRTEGIWMTVSSRPESTLMFFDRDGSAITTLGVTSVDDISAGIAAVTTDTPDIYQFGFSARQGFWADIPDTEPGRVLNRSRRLNLPVFETLRSDNPAMATFAPSQLDAAGLAKAIARTQSSPTEACSVTVDMQHQRSAPVAKIECQSKTSYADMAGRDMTALIG